MQATKFVIHVAAKILAFAYESPQTQSLLVALSQHNSISVLLLWTKFISKPQSQSSTRSTYAFLHDDMQFYARTHFPLEINAMFFFRHAYLELSAKNRMAQLRLNKNDGYQMHNIYPLAEQ